MQGTGVTVSGSEPSAQLLTETRTSLSLDGFFAQMGKTSAADVSWLGKFLQSLTDLPIEPRVGSNGDTLMLRGPLGTGDTASLMYINPPYASFWGVNYGGTRKTAAGRDAIRAFCESVAELVPGASVVTSPGGDMDVKINGANIPLRLLHGLDTGLKTAMSEFLRTVNISQDDSSGGRVAIAEEEFFELLGQRDPRVPELLRSFLAKAESLMGVYTDFQGAMNLKHASPTGRQLNMATITKGGVVDTGPSTWWDRRALGQSYNEKLAKLIGGSVNEKGELRIAGKMPRLSDLLPYEQACPSAFARGCSASRGL